MRREVMKRTKARAGKAISRRVGATAAALPTFAPPPPAALSDALKRPPPRFAWGPRLRASAAGRAIRSEERRVGKEYRSGCAPDGEKNNHAKQVDAGAGE